MTSNKTQSNLSNKSWVRRMAELEDQHPAVSVGGMVCDLGMFKPASGKPMGIFGRFVEFARRKQKLTVEDFASKAGVDLQELVNMEQNPDARPQITTVHLLAKFLKLPPKPLMELAGLLESKEVSIGSAALRFAARAETNAELNPQETQAFDEFVKVIVEASD